MPPPPVPISRAQPHLRLPPVLSLLTSLTSLSLAHTPIASPPSALASLTRLRHLDLSSNRIPPPSRPASSPSQSSPPSASTAAPSPRSPPPSRSSPPPPPPRPLPQQNLHLRRPPHLPPLPHPPQPLHQPPGAPAHLPPSLPPLPIPAGPRRLQLASFAELPASHLTHLDLSSNRLEAFPMVVLQLTRLETLLLDDQKGWQWYNTLPLGANGRSVRRRCTAGAPGCAPTPTPEGRRGAVSQCVCLSDRSAGQSVSQIREMAQGAALHLRLRGDGGQSVHQPLGQPLTSSHPVGQSVSQSVSQWDRARDGHCPVSALVSPHQL